MTFGVHITLTITNETAATRRRLLRPMFPWSDVSVCLSLSVTRLRHAKTVERIEVLLEVETGGPVDTA